MLRLAVTGLRDVRSAPQVRLGAGVTEAVRRELAERPLRDLALHGAWYEIFPRSEGATFDEISGRWTSGTFRTAARRLNAIAAMGFDVVYLTPVHPIGRINRKHVRPY